MKYSQLILIVLIALLSFSCQNGEKDRKQDIPVESVDNSSHQESFTGYFESDYDGSLLTITEREDGRYDVEAFLYRLTYLDDGVGTEVDGGIDFTATDAAGEPIGARITIDNDTALLTFTHSTWSLIEEGAQWEFKRK